MSKDSAFWQIAEKLAVLLTLSIPILAAVGPGITTSETQIGGRGMSSTLPSSAMAGWLGALLAMMGFAIGKVLEHSVSKTGHPWLARGLNDLFRMSFWVFGILFILASLGSAETTTTESTTPVGRLLVLSLSCGVLMGIVFPLLIRRFFGNWEGTIEPRSSGSAARWGACAGSIFGFLAGLAAGFAETQEISVGDRVWYTLGPAALCAIYGLFWGFATERVGGIGTENFADSTEYLQSSMLGILLGGISAVALALCVSRLRNFESLGFILLIGVSSGALLGTIYPPNVSKLFVRSLAWGRHSPQELARTFKLVFMLATSLPWGMLVVLGIRMRMPSPW